jgi:hypothetical protein
MALKSGGGGGLDGDLVVEYSGGATGFIGKLSDAMIEEAK